MQHPLQAMRVAQRAGQLVAPVQVLQRGVAVGELALERCQALLHMAAIGRRVGLQPRRHLVDAALEQR